MTGKWWEMFVFGARKSQRARSSKRSKHEEHAKQNIAYES